MMFYKEANKPLEISQLVAMLTDIIENDNEFRRIKVQGELGNFKMHSTAWYFSLKDKNASIPCVMWPGYARTVDFKPNNGDVLIAICDLRVYQKESRVQLYVYKLEKAGQGDFYIQFEKTKQKLEPLGYFDESHKKPIPKYPRQISVITGKDAHALGDIRITIARRWPNVILKEIYATVQGASAPASLIEAVQTADQQGSDVIILARGGGSIDELWCFNDEKLAIAIYNCKTPLITGVGHEYDVTIVDFVADKRAATPTAAAQAATPDRNEVISQITGYRNIMRSSVERLYERQAQTLYGYMKSLMIMETKATALNKQKSLLVSKISDGFSQKIASETRRLQYADKLIATNILNKVSNTESTVTRIKDSIRKSAELLFNRKAGQFKVQLATLDAISPLKTMERGYVISSQNGHVIRSVNDVEMDKCIDITYADGIISALPKERK